MKGKKLHEYEKKRMNFNHVENINHRPSGLQNWNNFLQSRDSNIQLPVQTQVYILISKLRVENDISSLQLSNSDFTIIQDQELLSH